MKKRTNSKEEAYGEYDCYELYSRSDRQYFRLANVLLLPHPAKLFYINHLFYICHENRSAAGILVGTEKFYQDGKNAARDEFDQGKILWKW